MTFTTGPDQVYAVLSALGDAGRAFDLTHIVPLDLVFPFTYAPLPCTRDLVGSLPPAPGGQPVVPAEPCAGACSSSGLLRECRGHHPAPHVPGTARSRCMVCEPHVQRQVFLLGCQFHHALCSAGRLCHPAPAPLYWQESCIMTGTGVLHGRQTTGTGTPSTQRSRRPSARQSGSLLRTRPSSSPAPSSCITSGRRQQCASSTSGKGCLSHRS